MGQKPGCTDKLMDLVRWFTSQVLSQDLLTQVISGERVERKWLTGLEDSFGLFQEDAKTLLDKIAGGMAEECDETPHLHRAPLLTRRRQSDCDQWGWLHLGTASDTAGLTQVCGVAEELGVPGEIPAAKGLQRMVRDYL
jgi:hypothetical protein